MKWIKINAGGVATIHFRVRGYKPHKRPDLDEWCVVDLVVESDIINYALRDDEALEIQELERVEEKLDLTLKGEGDDCSVVDPMEPYMIFEFHPRYEKKIFPNMFWKIILWSDDGAPSESTINLALYEEEMKLLSLYLKYASGRLKEDSPEIDELIQQGLIYGD